MTAALAVAALFSAVLLVYARRWMHRTSAEIARLDDENRRLRTELAVLRAAHRAHVGDAEEPAA